MSRTEGACSGDGIELASRTDVGQVRSANEDSHDALLRADGARLLVVADGMGGHRGGATASQSAIAAIAEAFAAGGGSDSRALLDSAIQSANARVFALAEADPELGGMGTTVVALLLDAGRQATVAHVGDSRAYRYRRGRIEPLTTDHSVVAEMQRRGLISDEEAALHPRRNEILRSVGVLPSVEVELGEVDVEAGDRFILCSDGLSNLVQDHEIAASVQSQSPAEAADSLVRLANERGGPDNITVQILAIPADEKTGDPEATAPVELSEVGIEAIESRRRVRRRKRRLALAVGVLTFFAALYVGLQATRREGMERTTRSPRPPSPATTPAKPPTARQAKSSPTSSDEAPEPLDRFEGTSETPRRGIPRGER